jgi:hypothetical protein
MPLVTCVLHYDINILLYKDELVAVITNYHQGTVTYGPRQ